MTPPSTGTVGVTPNEAPFGANAWTFTIKSQPVNVVSNWSDVTWRIEGEGLWRLHETADKGKTLKNKRELGGDEVGLSSASKTVAPFCPKPVIR